MKKSAYSPDFGAGWASWYSIHTSPDEERQARLLMMTWPPLIEAIEAGDDLTKNDPAFSDRPDDWVPGHPAIQSLADEFKKHGWELPYWGGLRCMTVAEIPDGRQFQIHEYDGSESLVFAERDDWY